jgi:hypothetical protein
MDEYSGQRPERMINLNVVAQPTILWFETASKIGEQMGRFLNDRAKRNMDTWEALSKCDSPVKAMEVQQRWVADMLRDYAEQSHRMMEITGSVMQEFLERRPQGQS